MQDRIYRIVEIFLHRTTGPYIRVKSSGQPNDRVASGFPQTADMAAAPALFSSGPKADITRGSPLGSQ
ncbi:hypothetical protein AYJ54_37025 [Bradyrhizobium centrolobii]|uniref:Uncharacterized protein n=1 Tax=Bradyrhizobium centrolobii TaxID=1505087 RepID=A0A176Y6T9_9BRAD|nr:hypothetical protein [Bradyrhizobium centrolobii]OAE96198.1 hypothetical protein AYJ54_37025 [Bradyrhizobium centrolobii]